MTNNRSAYKAVIFDLGNVIIDVQFQHCFDLWAQRTGADALQIKKLFQFDQMYEAHERNEINAQNYHHYIKGMLDIPLTFEDFKEGWNCVFGSTIPETESFIQKYSPSIPMYVLTNSNVLHREVWSQTFQKELAPIKQIFCSSQMQHRKPEPEAFSFVLNSVHLKPHEVVFIDDKEEHTLGAEEEVLVLTLWDEGAISCV